MKIKLSLIIILIFLFAGTNAQLFISKGKIEYEVKSDFKKTMGDNTFYDQLKDKLPRFKTGVFTLTFADDKSIYRFDHWGEPKLPDFMTRGEDEDNYYYDYSSGKFDRQKNVYGTNINVADSIPKLNWKLENENRIIAGFNCRKAVAILFDSVYVFAFYTEEITLTGGPGSFQGLPGTIMGVTIPRLYTSWIATKLTVNGIDVSEIRPVTTKKMITMTEFKSIIKERTSDWYSPDDPEQAEEARQQKDRFIWETLL